MSDVEGVYEIVRCMNDDLKGDDPRFKEDTFVALDRGEFHLWYNAFYERVLDNDRIWVVVFTEHSAFHIFDAEDVYWVSSDRELITRLRGAMWL